MRVVIVGGGVIALLTAVECVSAGHEVVLVDQADIPFSGATSFDRHRVTRALHLNDPAKTVAAVHAHHRWLGLQDILSTHFYEPVGALTVLPAEELSPARGILTRAGSRARVMSPAELAAAYPQIDFPAGASAVLESHAGVLLADRILAACAGWLRWHDHAELHPHRKAVEIDVTDGAVQLADGEILGADAVLLAVGPWSRELLAPELAAELVLHRQSMLYCEVPAMDEAAWSMTPPIIGLNAGAWLVPPVAGTPLKLSVPSACRVVSEVGDNATSDYWHDHILDAFAGVIQGLRSGWVTDARDCYYLARASTQGSMLAVLGDRVMSFAACGGSSFKFAPLIARSLADRLAGKDPVPTGLSSLDRPLEPLLRGTS